MTSSLAVCCGRCHCVEVQRNGYSKNGTQRYRCKRCGTYGTVQSRFRYTETRKQEILSAYQERMSLRGIERVFGVSRRTVSLGLKKKAQSLPELANTLLPAVPSDVLELDEVWSFGGNKTKQSWLWTALCAHPTNRCFCLRKPRPGN